MSDDGYATPDGYATEVPRSWKRRFFADAFSRCREDVHDGLSHLDASTKSHVVSWAPTEMYQNTDECAAALKRHLNSMGDKLQEVVGDSTFSSLQRYCLRAVSSG